MSDEKVSIFTEVRIRGKILNYFIYFCFHQINPKTSMEEKRNIPPLLVKILEIDVIATKKFVAFLLNFLSMRSLRTHCKILEVSTLQISPKNI